MLDFLLLLTLFVTFGRFSEESLMSATTGNGPEMEMVLVIDLC